VGGEVGGEGGDVVAEGDEDLDIDQGRGLRWPGVRKART